MSEDILHQLQGIIRQRTLSTTEKSYTKSLLDAGVQKCAKKLGEEATELVIAALSETDEDVINEAADLIYHMLVLLESRSLSIDMVEKILQARMAQSGHQEKASRSNS